MAEVNLTLGYAGTNFTRGLTLPADDTIAANDVRSVVQEINASLTGSTDDGLGAFFNSDDGDYLASITAAEISVDSFTQIYPTVQSGN